MELEISAVALTAPSTAPIITQPDDLVTSTGLKASLGGISEMTLFRWTRDRGFPKPDKIINRRKFWRRSTIYEWLARQPSAEDAKVQAPPRIARKKAETVGGAA